MLPCSLSLSLLIHKKLSATFCCRSTQTCTNIRLRASLSHLSETIPNRWNQNGSRATATHTIFCSFLLLTPLIFSFHLQRFFIFSVVSCVCVCVSVRQYGSWFTMRNRQIPKSLCIEKPVFYVSQANQLVDCFLIRTHTPKSNRFLTFDSTSFRTTIYFTRTLRKEREKTSSLSIQYTTCSLTFPTPAPLSFCFE